MSSDRLEVATKLLSALLIGQQTIWCKDPDACASNDELLDEAIKLADSLIAKTSQESFNVSIENRQEQNNAVILAWIEKSKQTGVYLDLCGNSDWFSDHDQAKQALEDWWEKENDIYLVRCWSLQSFYKGVKIFEANDVGFYTPCDDEFFLSCYKEIEHLVPSEYLPG